MTNNERIMNEHRNILYKQTVGSSQEKPYEQRLLDYGKSSLIVSPNLNYKYDDRPASIGSMETRFGYNQLKESLPNYLSNLKTGKVNDELQDIVDMSLSLIYNVTPDVAGANRQMYINQYLGRDADNQTFASAMWEGFKSYYGQKKIANLMNRYDAVQNEDYKKVLLGQIEKAQSQMNLNQDFVKRSPIGDLMVRSSPIIAQSAEAMLTSLILGHVGGMLANRFGDAVKATSYMNSLKEIENAKKTIWIKDYFKKKFAKAGLNLNNTMGYFSAKGKEAGAIVGTIYNTMANTYTVERGMASLEMYQAGITNDRIRNQFATTIGLINSFIEVVTIDPFMGREQLGKNLRKFSLSDILGYGEKTGAFTRGATDFLFEAGKSTFEESLEEGMQGAVSEYFSTIAQELNNAGAKNMFNDGKMYKGLFSGEKLEKAFNAFTKDFKDALGPSAVLGFIGAGFTSVGETLSDSVSADKLFRNTQGSKVVSLDSLNIDVTKNDAVTASMMYMKQQTEKQSLDNISDKKTRKGEEKKVKQDQMLDPIRVHKNPNGTFTPISPKDTRNALIASYNDASGVRVIVYEAKYRPANKTGLKQDENTTVPHDMLDARLNELGFEEKGDMYIATGDTSTKNGYEEAQKILDKYAVEDIMIMPNGGEIYTFKDENDKNYRVYIAQNEDIYNDEMSEVQDTLKRTREYYTRPVDEIKMVSSLEELDNYKNEQGTTAFVVNSGIKSGAELVKSVSNAVVNAYNNKSINTTKIDADTFNADVESALNEGKFKSKDKAYNKLVDETVDTIHNVVLSNMYTLDGVLDYFTKDNKAFDNVIKSESERNKNAIFKREGIDVTNDAEWQNRSDKLAKDRQEIKDYIHENSKTLFNAEENETISDAMATFIQMLASNAGMTGMEWLKKNRIKFKEAELGSNIAGSTTVENEQTVKYKGHKEKISDIVIRATTSANLSTFEHEMIHALFKINDGNIQEQFKNIFNDLKDNEQFKEYLKAHKAIFRDSRFNENTWNELFKNGWTWKEDEFVAYLYEAYRSDERYNDKKLNTFFGRIKNFFRNFVHSLAHTVKLNDEVVDFYEGLFNTDILNYTLYQSRNEMMQGLANQYYGNTEYVQKANKARARLDVIGSALKKALKVADIDDVVSTYATLAINLSKDEKYDTIINLPVEETVAEVSKIVGIASGDSASVSSNLDTYIKDKLDSAKLSSDNEYINSFVNMFAESLRKDNIISYDTYNQIKENHKQKENFSTKEEVKATEDNSLHQTMYKENMNEDDIQAFIYSLFSADNNSPTTYKKFNKIDSFANAKRELLNNKHLYIKDGFEKSKTPEMQDIEAEAKNNGTFMKAPNGAKTHLTKYQWLQVRTKAFKEWFGDWENDPENASKVIDENGEPLVVYHGTPSEFDRFLYNGSGYHGVGLYTTMYKDYAEGYGNHVMPLFANIKHPQMVGKKFNPITKEQNIAIANFLKDYFTSMGEEDYANEIYKDFSAGTYTDPQNVVVNALYKFPIDDKWNKMAEDIYEKFTEITGYDGVIVDYKGFYVPYLPNQLKSAIGNNGDFSVDNDDIRYQTAPKNEYLQKLDDEYFNAIADGDMAKVQQMVQDRASQLGIRNAYMEDGGGYSIRTKPAPKKTIKVYKVFTVDEQGRPTALYVNSGIPLPMNTWLEAHDTWHFQGKNANSKNGGLHWYVPSRKNPYTESKKATGDPIIIQNEEDRQKLIEMGYKPSKRTKERPFGTITGLSYRPGWHAGDLPFFPQGGTKIAGANYGMAHRYNQVIFECEMSIDTDYSKGHYTENGKWQWDDMTQIPVDGSYRFLTNPLAKSTDIGTWYIGGSLKINRALTEEEANKILAENGRKPQQWQSGPEATTLGPLDLDSLNVSTEPIMDGVNKTLAPITYDDNGEIIPLSERFNQSVNDVRYQTIGEKGAKNIESIFDNLKDAKANYSNNAEMKAKTGWEKGADGKYRYNIVDQYKDFHINKLTNLKEGESVKLSELYSNDMLYTLYPSLENLPIVAKDLGSNTYGESLNDCIYINTNYKKSSEDYDYIMFKSLMHELQHKIQQIEKFVIGDSPSYVKGRYLRLKNRRKNLINYNNNGRKRYAYEAIYTYIKDNDNFLNSKPYKGYEIYRDNALEYKNYLNELLSYVGISPDTDIEDLSKRESKLVLKRAKELYTQYVESWKSDDEYKLFDNIHKDDKYEIYFNNRGEVEARITEKFGNLDALTYFPIENFSDVPTPRVLNKSSLQDVMYDDTSYINPLYGDFPVANFNKKGERINEDGYPLFIYDENVLDLQIKNASNRIDANYLNAVKNGDTEGVISALHEALMYTPYAMESIENMISPVIYDKSGDIIPPSERFYMENEVQTDFEDVFQTVFHGTIYNIERFDTSKIGTGEGTHVFGWGLYFSQRYGVAESYAEIAKKNNFAINKNAKYHSNNLFKWRTSIDTKTYSIKDLEVLHSYLMSPVIANHVSKKYLNEFDKYYKLQQKAYDKKLIKWFGQYDYQQYFSYDLMKITEEYFDYATNYNNKNLSSIDSYVYTVEVPDDNGAYINWYEKPSQEIIEKAKNTFILSRKDINELENFEDFGKLYTKLTSLVDNGKFNDSSKIGKYKASDEAVSKWLYSEGYIGVKQQIGSAHKGYRPKMDYEGNFNLIIFNDNDIKIKNRRNLLTNEIEEYEQALYQTIFSDEGPQLTAEDAERAKQFMDEMDSMYQNFGENDFTGYRSANGYERQIINGFERVQGKLSMSDDVNIPDLIEEIEALKGEYERLNKRDLFYNAQNDKDKIERRELAKQALATITDIQKVLKLAIGKSKSDTLSDNRVLNAELVNYEALRAYAYDKMRNEKFFEYLQKKGKHGEIRFKDALKEADREANALLSDEKKFSEIGKELESLAPTLEDKGKYMAKNMINDAVAELASKVSINALVQGLLLGYAPANQNANMQAIEEVRAKLEEMDNRLADWEEHFLYFENIWTDPNKTEGVRLTPKQFAGLKKNMHTLSEMNIKQTAIFLQNSLGLDMGTTPVFSEYYELLGMFNSRTDRKAMLRKIMKATDGTLLGDYILDNYEGTTEEAYNAFYDDLAKSHKKYHDIMADKEMYAKYFDKVFNSRSEAEYAKKPYIKNYKKEISEILYELSLNRTKSYSEQMKIIRDKVHKLGIKSEAKSSDLAQKVELDIKNLFDDFDSEIRERMYLDSARQELFRQFKGNVAPDPNIKYFINRVYEMAHSYPKGQGYMAYYNRLYDIQDVLANMQDYQADDEIFKHNLPSRIRRNIIRSISSSAKSLYAFYDLVNSVTRPVREIELGTKTKGLIDHLKAVLDGIELVDEDNMVKLNITDVKKMQSKLETVLRTVGSKEFARLSNEYSLLSGDIRQLIEFLKSYNNENMDEVHRATVIRMQRDRIQSMINELTELGKKYDVEVTYVPREYNRQYFKGSLNDIFNAIKSMRKSKVQSIDEIAKIRDMMMNNQIAVFSALIRSLDDKMESLNATFKDLGVDEADGNMMRYYLTMPEADVNALDKIFLTREERKQDKEYFKSTDDISTISDIIGMIEGAQKLLTTEKISNLRKKMEGFQRQNNEYKARLRKDKYMLSVFTATAESLGKENTTLKAKVEEMKQKYKLTADELKVANWMIGVYDKENTSQAKMIDKLNELIDWYKSDLAHFTSMLSQNKKNIRQTENAYRSAMAEMDKSKIDELDKYLSKKISDIISKASVNGESAVEADFIPVLEWFYAKLGFPVGTEEVKFYTDAGKTLAGKVIDENRNRKKRHKGADYASKLSVPEQEVLDKINSKEFAHILDAVIEKSYRKDYSIAKMIKMGNDYYIKDKDGNRIFGWSYSQRKMMHEILMEADYSETSFAELYNGYYTAIGENANLARKENLSEYTDQEIATIIAERSMLEMTGNGRQLIDDVISIMLDNHRVDPTLKEDFLKPLKDGRMLNEFRQDENGATVYDENGKPVRKKEKKFYQDIYAEFGTDEYGNEEERKTLRDILFNNPKEYENFSVTEKAQLVQLIQAMAKDSREKHRAKVREAELKAYGISNNMANEIVNGKTDAIFGYSDAEQILRLLSSLTQNGNMLKTHLELTKDDSNSLRDTTALDSTWVLTEIQNAKDPTYKQALTYLNNYLETGEESQMASAMVYFQILYQNNYNKMGKSMANESDKERLKKFLKNSKYGFEKPQRLARRLGDTAYKLLVEEAWKHQNEEERQINRRLSAFSEEINKLGFGKGELFNILKQTVTVGDRSMRYTTYEYDENGKKTGESTADLTYENLMAIYIYSKSMAGLEKLKSGQGNNFSEESILDVVEFMEDKSNETAQKLKALCEWMMNDFEESFARLNDASKLFDNVPLEQRFGYFPQKSQRGEFLLGESYKGSVYTKTKVADNMTYLLSDTIYPLDLNAISTYITGVQAHEHYMAFGGYAKKLDMVVDKGNLKNIIQVKYGNDTVRQLENYIERIKNPPIEEISEAERVFLKVLNNVATAKLAGSLTTVTKQILSAVTAWANGEASFFSIMKNFVFFLTHPDDSFIDFIYDKDPSMVNRTAEYLAKQLSDSRDFLVKSKIGEIRDVMMKPIQYMDKATALAVWKSVYEQKISEGMAVEEASFRAQQVVQETQSTGENLSLAPFQTKRNPFVKLALLFTNDLFQIWNVLFSDVPQNIRDGQFAKSAKKLTGVAILGISMALLAGGWIPNDDEEGFDWMAFIRDMGEEFAEMGIPIAGPQVADLMSGWTRSVFTLPQELIQLPKNIAKAGERTGEENIEQVYDFLASFAEMTGAPTVAIKRGAKAVYNTTVNRDLLDLLYIFGKRWGEGWD